MVFVRIGFDGAVKSDFIGCFVHSCYYTSRFCKYFIGGECYENYTASNNASLCAAKYGGILLRGSCYYRQQRSCSGEEYLQQCTCYRHRSATYSNNTCINIGGYYTDDYCYYFDFNCSRYPVNGQCYTRVNNYKVMNASAKLVRLLGYIVRELQCLFKRDNFLRQNSVFYFVW